jgi:hypothetical protein
MHREQRQNIRSVTVVPAVPFQIGCLLAIRMQATLWSFGWLRRRMPKTTRPVATGVSTG